ncbi:MAG TPA: ABC transporter six-transmembrane domain-containing protein [Gemmataceae bacterium]|nr:ABC transporter six-transmembrane domain-containing protein [Gemmataceae bacterium]
MSTVTLTLPTAAKGPGLLRSLIQENKWRVLITYALFNLESLLQLAQPFLLGLAIDDLFHDSMRGVILLAVQHLSFVALTVLRRVYDVRTFGRICTNLAVRLVTQQRQEGAGVSAVAARSALSREVVSFFQHDIPVVVQVIYSVLGGLVMLCFYDMMLVLLGLALMAPVLVLNRFYSRVSLKINSQLHDELEREVTCITGNDPQAVHAHYEKVNNHRIRLFDAEAANFGMLQIAILGVMVAALVRCCSILDGQVGNVFAVFRYVMTVVTGLQGVPLLVQQVTRLRDIVRRVQS